MEINWGVDKFIDTVGVLKGSLILSSVSNRSKVPISPLESESKYSLKSEIPLVRLIAPKFSRLILSKFVSPTVVVSLNLKMTILL